MHRTDITPNMQSWTDELNSVGRVEVKTTFTSLIWRVGLAIAIVVIFDWLRYEAGDIVQRGLTIAIIAFAALVIGLVVFVRTR